MREFQHELFDFVLSVTEGLAREYERIRGRATEDPGTAGDEGEENWANLLREWLPPAYHVVTKGRILGCTGQAGPQVDVIVLQPTYPKYLLTKKLYLAGGVAAAFECKLTLKAQHVREATETAVAVRHLLPRRLGTPYRELHSPITYGLLAHAHTWKGANAASTIDRLIKDADEELVHHPREGLDVVCVANEAAFLQSRSSLLDRNHGLSISGDSQMMPATGYTIVSPDKTFAAYRFGEEERPDRNPFTPIGTFLCFLLRRLAWEDPAIRPLADYFSMTGVQGAGVTPVRWWPVSVYDTATQLRLQEGLNAIPPRLPNFQPWDEWTMNFD
jgi:hypothetical protein